VEHGRGFGNVELFAGWRGRPFDVYTAFVSYDTWAKMLGFPANTSFPNFAKKPAWISLGYPLLPKTSDGVIVLSPELWDQLAETDPVKQTAAARLFWARHLQILDNIKNSLKTNTTYLGLVIRFGWEFNGSSSYWKLTDYTKAPQYRAVFQRLVDEARSRMPNVVIDWNPLRKGSEGAYFQDIYPGDAYVDIISICHYDRLPSFDSQQIWDEQAVRRAMVIIERAIGNSQTEVQVYRFPNALCSDGGRAINQHEPGWEKTLTGVPREVYELWDRQFRPRGYKLKAEIVDFPGGVPGDVAFTLGWA